MSRKFGRRQFLKLGAAGAAASVLAGCVVPRRWVVLEPFVHPPEDQVAGVPTWYATTCRQCPAGCGVIVRVMNGRALKLEGNPEHPLNQGKLCARGQAGVQLLYNPDRLQGPAAQARRGTRNYASLPWNEGLNTLFEKLNAAGNQVAIWTGLTVSGHLYDLFSRFARAIGSPQPIVYDLYAGMQGYELLSQVNEDMFGKHVLPSYRLGRAELILSFGADFVGTGQSAVRYGIEFGDFRSQLYGKRGKLVQFEPRMSMTAAKADRWWPIRPGTEGLVAHALVRLAADQGLGVADRLQRARALAGEVDVSAAAQASQIPLNELVSLASEFATTEHVVAIAGGATGGLANALEVQRAVQALNLISGSDTFALQADAPMPELARPQTSRYQDVQHLIDQMRAGAVQVLMVYGANPVFELPREAGLLEALGKVPFVVSFAPLVDETATWADLILPERTYLEGWGYEVVSPNFGIPVVGSQQPVVTPVFDSRATADILLEIARGIPAEAAALPWQDEVEFLHEVLGRLPTPAYGGSGSDVVLARFQQHGGWWVQPAAGTAPAAVSAILPLSTQASEFHGDEQEYPFYLHLYSSVLLSDGRGASLPMLQGVPDPMTTMAWQSWAELNPQTAQTLGLDDGDVVRITSVYGQMEVPVYVTKAIRPDTVAIATGQGHSDLGRYARNRGVNPLLVTGNQTDESGAVLAWENVRVKVERTGRRIAQARFESKAGVAQGFPNQAFPGQ